MNYKPRTLVITWDDVSYSHDHEVRPRVKTMDHALRQMKKLNQDNIHKAIYIDAEGKEHKLKLIRR